MNTLIVGGTGLIGRALSLRLLRDGHEVSILTRQEPARARQRVGGEVRVVNSCDEEAMDRALAASDAVVNLAGEDVAGGRWTAKRRQAIGESRAGLTRELVKRMAAHPPRVFICASAVGLYGDRGDEALDEQAAPGEGFLAEVCQQWEEAARGAEATGCRVVRLRIGVVLSDGGALGRMAPLFRLGLGGPVGHGGQYMSWIHLADLVELAISALTDDAYVGAINAVAPEPVTSRQFARTLGRVLGRPSFLPVPALLLQLMYGEMASVLLCSQRVTCHRAQHLGFSFRFPDLEAALNDLVGQDPSAKPPPPAG